MTDHEAMCPARRENWDDGSPFASPGECRCEEYARVRADERSKVYRPDAHRMMLERDAARAEVYAHEASASNMLIAWRNTRAEREAARAEVAALSAEIDRMVGELSSIRMEHEAEVAVLQDALEDVVNQACSESGTDLDSMALSAYAHGMRVLAERGRIIIEREVGRRVIGRWAEADRG